jgi:hypothetical protein
MARKIPADNEKYGSALALVPIMGNSGSGFTHFYPA